jgi:hypothetical protein
MLKVGAMRGRTGLALGAIACALVGSVARAQPAPYSPPAPGPLIAAPPQPEVAEVAALPSFERPPRPRLSLAVGMGATFDSVGFTDGTHAIPSFFATGGFGDGLLGLDLQAFASSASGRFPATEAPVDRLALDVFGVVRPAARFRRGDTRYAIRVLHTVAVELGLGLERDGRAMGSGSRFVVHTGARFDLPLTGAGEASELRLRFGVRRALGLYTPQLANGSSAADITFVGDSTELYSALVLVF